MRDFLDGACAHCGEKLTLKNIQCDHRRPTARSGWFSEWNLEWICDESNLAKGPLTDRSLFDAPEHAADFEVKARLNILVACTGGKMVKGF